MSRMSVLAAAVAKPRKATKADKAAWLNAARRSVIQQVQELEQQAQDTGLLITARALNNAMNAAGWEIAGNTHAADLASRGERVGK